MEETLRQHLLTLADAYASAEARSLQTLGREIMRDGSFFIRMRSGDNFTIKTFDKVVAWFSDRWPADLDWPMAIPRPASTAPAPTTEAAA